MLKIHINAGTSPCPMCREAISRQASICPHCRSDLRNREDWKVEPVQQGGCAAMLVVGAIGLSGLAGVGLSLLR
ncbi:hypothetical protein KBB96_18085 [Luteolibacter ambystomatis]|uniref:Zinc ribbon domain-containing protein n=1 Tax=Luteolibacter ambystomatis TaxID=2824561 RepID=A0A975IZB9_9BACT|nr:hypothetical protein [Luteolibacter ambystomatis]QUE50758.1 hypothetical protein KBB96_18085 [Luteolibacter ambystomatis]